jgi:phenylpropionate dioxygenase-like ring-hydroxylating dioxygenase large terminal subunit
MLRDYWYVAIWSGDLGQAPVARTLLGEAIVLFRDAAGRSHALQDRCPHRAVPLSKGMVLDGHLQCPYHGLEFDGTGACVKVPGQDTIPPDASVRAYPTIEKWRWVWVWIGDPAMADPALVPDFHWLEDPAWAAVTGEFTIKAGHELLLENLHNHTHLQFVHRNTIGTDDIVSAKTKVQRVGDQIHVDRWLFDRAPPALFARAGNFKGKVDRWFNSVFLPPTGVVLDIGCADAGSGAPEGDRSRGIEIRSLHAVTPIDARNCRYFWAYVRNFALDQDQVGTMLREGARATFLEDVDILEAQQDSLDRMPDQGFIDINVDAAPLQLKRLLNELRMGPRAPVG